MASTPDMAPHRTTTAAAKKSAAHGDDTEEGSEASEVELQKQIDALRADIKSIGTTLSKLGNEKVNEAQGRAKAEYRNLVETGHHLVDQATDEFTHVEKQLKDTIREKPITAVLSAVGIGYLIALLTR